jgi:hypothetical protein
MAKCETCGEYIERTAEDGSMAEAIGVADGDRPWHVVDGPMDQLDGTMGDAGIDDGDHDHVPARTVLVSTYNGGAGCSWDNRCGYTAAYAVGDALVCARDMPHAVFHAV